jgi:hypothetical protein
VERQLFQPMLAGEGVAVAVGEGGRQLILPILAGGRGSSGSGGGSYFIPCWLWKGWCSGVSDVR